MNVSKKYRRAPYTALPWQLDPWKDKSSVLLLSGAAGGGKSRLAAEKVHAYLLRYPGATGLLLRKTRTSLKNSTLLFMQHEVMGNDPTVKHKKADFRFEYPNGSILAYGGMKDDEQKEAIRGIGKSGGIDIALMEEATQFSEADFNELSGRIRGTAAPWRQIVLATNPGGPMHWIKQRLIDAGEAAYYASSAADNIYNPSEYIKRLNSLTGIERERLYEGKWVQSEDLVYEIWHEDKHVTPAADYQPGGGPVYWGVDDGYAGELAANGRSFKAGSHPRVFLLAQMRSGVLNVFQESYAVKTKAEQQIYDVYQFGYPEPEFCAVDKSAASLKGDLREGSWLDKRWQLYTRNSPPRVDESIKETRNWLDPDENQHVRIKVHPRCKMLRGEMLSYANNPTTGKPIKDFDHGPDALRSLVWTLRIT